MAISAQKLLGGSTEQKLLGGSTESKTKNTKFLAKVSKSNLSVTKRVKPTKLVEKPKVVSSSKQENTDLAKVKALLNSLVKSTNSLKKAAKKDSQDQTKANKDRKKKKGDVQAKKREEKTETKKVKAQVTKKMELPKAPDFFKDIMGMLGRFTLSVGIMQLLKFMTDTEASDSIFGFLEKHIDKITIGFLGIMGALFISSFVPVISMAISLLSILAPVIKVMTAFIIKSIASMLLNPLVWKAVIIAILGKAIYDDLMNRGTDKNDGITGENAAWRKEELTSRERVIVVATIYGRDRSNWPDDVVKDVNELNKKSDARDKDKKKSFLFGGGNVYTDPSQYQDPDNLTDLLPNVPEIIVPKNFTPEDDAYSLPTPQHQGPVMGTPPPEVKPQTPMVGDTKLGGISGHSGSVAYDGQQQAPLSTSYSPFAQSDIDEQGMSIISGKGYRASTQSNHKGYDIPAIKGTPVYAYMPGRITRNGPISGYGNVVEWQDDVYGEKHMFAHLMAPGPLKVGEKFSAGTMLAKTGDTGTPGSYHLHWEIGAVGAEVDPGEWIKKRPIKMTPKQTPDKAQKVSSTTSYEETGTQIALLEVPVSTPSGGGGGGSSRSSGSSGSGGDVNTYTGDLIVASHYREA